MENYIGKICPYCKTEIKEGEAVKVCPACGIAHHESCWEENHGCTTFGCSQQNSVQPQAAKAFCVKCGAELPAGSSFCVQCGTPVSPAPTPGAPVSGMPVSGPAMNPAPQQNAYVPPANPGAPVNSAAPVNPTAPAYPGPGYIPAADPAKPKINADYIADTIAKKSNSIIAFIGGLFSGVVSIIFGIVCFCLDTGSYLSYQSYGGDAYTGIQHASAGTGNNVQDLAGIVKFGFGALLVVLGLALCCFFISKIIEAKSKNKA